MVAEQPDWFLVKMMAKQGHLKFMSKEKLRAERREHLSPATLHKHRNLAELSSLTMAVWSMKLNVSCGGVEV